MSVIFETSLGDITIDLYVDKAPKTCLNFLKLCKIKYFDHCLFHNIQKDFIVQTGDPTGTGDGGQSIWGLLNGEINRFFDDEIVPQLKHNKKGIVGMVSAGKNRNASQFYITTSSYLPRLDGVHTIFGEVAEGMETLSKINEAVVNLKGQPVQLLRIIHSIILEDPFEDPQGLIVPSRSPSPPRNWAFEMLPEEMDMMDSESRDERLADETAQAKAEALALIGELPDADIKPPENVLFVCKLNPTTSGHSLAILFSRFGKILSSEVIKDRHGSSLCYAFVEFERKEDCEEAYMKMQDVLIDGHRIHVDFSQSVSKTVNWKSVGGWKNFFAEQAKARNSRGGNLPGSKQPYGDMVFRRNNPASIASFRRYQNQPPPSSSIEHHSSRKRTYDDRYQNRDRRPYDDEDGDHRPSRHSSDSRYHHNADRKYSDRSHDGDRDRGYYGEQEGSRSSKRSKYGED